MQHIILEIPPAPFFPYGAVPLVVIVFHTDWEGKEVMIRVEPVGWGSPTWWLKMPGYPGFPFRESVLKHFSRTIHHGVMKMLYLLDRRAKTGWSMGMQMMGGEVGMSVDEGTWEMVKGVMVGRGESEREVSLLRDVGNMLASIGNVGFRVHERMGRRELPEEFLMGGMELYRHVMERRVEVEGYKERRIEKGKLWGYPWKERKSSDGMGGSDYGEE